jgi:hypothetical protein
MINTFIQKSIIILETSAIIQKGLYRILVESDLNCSIIQLFGFDELKSILSRKEVDIAIINPVFILNNMNIFKHLKNQYANTQWLALHCSYIDVMILSEFNSVLQISDSSELIIEKLKSIQFVTTQPELIEQ